MSPFAFRSTCPRRALDAAAPVPSPDVLVRYLAQRTAAGDSVREIADELELDESEVLSALREARRER
ncbi:MAG: hypothetical protein IPN34_15910 [Planctomycetes bacterium]|nr:hypothetical protein [Planctomycetota bacterium]